MIQVLLYVLKQVSTTTTDNSCDSVVMSGQQQQQNPAPQHSQRDDHSPAGYLTFVTSMFFFFLQFMLLLCKLIHARFHVNYFCFSYFLCLSLLAIAEETLAEFLGKATGTAVDWVQMIGMKVGICNCRYMSSFLFISFFLLD